ncbi:MAG: hypothetical protein ACKOYM_04150 [Actinomycetes bacterium]
MESPVPVEIINPIAQFHLEGDPDAPEDVVAIATFFGEDGTQVEMHFTRPGHSGALAELLWECAIDLWEGQTKGIMAVVARKGEHTDEPLTVDRILDAADYPILPNPLNPRNLIFPWQVERGDEPGVWSVFWEDPPWGEMGLYPTDPPE